MVKNEQPTEGKTNIGKLWGLICFVPCGWLFFADSILRRKNDVIKRGMSAEFALAILHNYIVSFAIVMAITAALCVISWGGGTMVYIPNLISVFIVAFIYNSAVKKITKYDDEQRLRGQHKSASTKSKSGVTKQEEAALRELKEQSHELDKKIKKLEKKINEKSK